MRIRIVYKPDKTVSIIRPFPKSRMLWETEDEWLDRIYDRSIREPGLRGLPWEDVDESELPPKKYREAWEGEKGKKICINRDKIGTVIVIDRLGNRERIKPVE